LDQHRHKPALSKIVRWQSTRSNNKKGGFQLDALPFSVSPEEALEKFRKWAEDDQSLRYLMNYDSVRIGGAYVPVWSFDLNIRFPKQCMPPAFASAFSTSGDTIHLPGLSAYAGYSYRRSLLNPVHSTSLVFMGDQTESFGGWMLRDMVLKSTGAPISITPDAWNATQGRALQIVRQDLQSLVDASWTGDPKNIQKVKLQVVKSRRVFMPTFVIDYSIFGLEYRAFVSGCDQGASVAGVSHQVFGGDSMFNSPEYHQSSASFLTQGFQTTIQNIIRRPGLVQILLPFLRQIGAVVWFLGMRILPQIPVIGLTGGFFAGYRKIYHPWMDNKRASAEWERQRENEAQMEDDDEETLRKADFVDSRGAARLYFHRNKTRILNELGGDTDHEQGGYAWYDEWQQWAQKQYEKQQQDFYQQQQQYQQQQKQQSQRYQRTSDKYHWDFDPNDPYSVLGLKRGASKEEVSKAFRRQMLKNHPDTQPNATAAQKKRLTEQSKLITEAYRKIKTEKR
jgi:hypothetical protein